MGIFNRRHRPGAAVTAAATRIEPGDEDERARIRRGPEEWQRQAWQFFNDLEAISYPAGYVSGAIGRLRIGAAMRPDPREQPVLVDSDGNDGLDITATERDALNATVDRLGRGPNPIQELQRLLSLNLFIAGDGYLVGYNDNGNEVWDVLSVSELVVDPNGGGGYARRMAPMGGPTYVRSLPLNSFVCRIYRRDPQWSMWAYSSMRSVLELCDELKILTDSIRAGASSRIPAGVMFLTHGMMGGPVDDTMIGQQDEAAQNPVIQRTIEHFETPIKNRKSASAVVPLMMIGEPEDIQHAHIWEPNRHIDSIAADQRMELLGRIAIGLDIPAEVLTGKVDLNHWTAWQVAEEVFKFHLEPSAQSMVYALTSGYFHPALEAMGVSDVNRFFVWYDSTDLISHPNRAQDYQDAFDRYEVSGDAYRRAKNIPESDAPDENEIAERAWLKIVERVRVSMAPGAPIPTPEDLLTGQLPTSGPTGEPTSRDGEVEPAPTVEPPPRQTTPSAPVKTAPPSQSPGGARAPHLPTRAAAVDLPGIGALAASASMGAIGPRLAQIERTLRLRLLQKADDVMQRALERAGNRLRGLAVKRGATMRALVDGIQAVDVAGRLGREKVAELNTSAADLLDGQFDMLHPDFDTWTVRAQEQALAAIDEFGELDDATAAMIAQEQARDREHGWAVLAAGLAALAASLLYQPHEPPPEEGEWTDFSVPPGLIRDALIAAGGGLVADGVTTGLMSGKTLSDAIDSAGLQITSYTWQHGDPARPFEPHEQLDGTVFYSPDDEVLANDQGWPDVEFFRPGDHAGCLCEVVEAVEALTPAGEEVD